MRFSRGVVRLLLDLVEPAVLVIELRGVADDLEDNLGVFRTACGRADLVIATGGLGPTLDDLTREVIAAVAGVPLEEHTPSLEHIKEMFARRGRVMPDRNHVQALLPKGAEAIPNAAGTAPGIWATVGKATVVAMPGVPSEMLAALMPFSISSLAWSGVMFLRDRSE